ncbi:MAG: tetratricopeptide repeat protein, partial [Acidobacteriota bacterium]
MQTVSHYRILKKLGEGGMGSVYLAHDELLHRSVAIKFPTLTDGAIDRVRFLREARLASALNHTNIATIYDCGETDDHQPFLVMELVTGEPLSRILVPGPLPIDRAVAIMTDVLAALGEAHRLGIVHRDVKPSNVMIGEGNRVKVLDFGLAKQLKFSSGARIGETTGERDVEDSTMTIPGTILGTPLYMSPEQARGESLDSRSDLFSAGVVLYQCLTGRPPFMGVSLMAIGAQILNSNPTPPSRLNPLVPFELERITLKSLEKDPARRFQSASELIASLRALGVEGPSFETILRVPEEPPTSPDVMHHAFETNVSAPAARTDERQQIETARGQKVAGLLRKYWWATLLLVGVVIVLIFLWGGSGRTVKPPSPAALRAYDEGTTALRDGAYLKANKILTLAVNSDPGFALAHARLAESWTELDNIDKASYEIAMARSLVPDTSVLEPTEARYLQAINDTVVGNRAAAIAHYQEVAKLEPDKAHVYLDLARAYERNRQTEPAVEHYQKALEHDPGIPSAHLRLGVLTARLQQESQALDHFDQAEKLYRTFTNPEGVTEVFYQRGLMYFNLGKMANARKQLETALAAARGDSPSDYQEIRCLLQLSNVSGEENDFTEAEALSAEAISLARKKGIEYLTTLGVISLGNIYFSRNRVVEAEKYIEEGLELARRYKTKRYEALALSTLGSLRVDQNRVDEGLQLLEQARDFFERSGYRRQALDARLLIGRTERDKGDYAAALRTFEEQLRSVEQSPDRGSIARAHEEIGKILLRTEKYPDALNHFEKSLAIHQAQGPKSSEFYSLINTARALGQLGLDQRAREMLSRATPIATTGAMKANLLNLESELAVIQREFAVAQSHSKRALSEAEANDPGLLFEIKLL